MRITWNAGRSSRGDRPVATIGLVTALALCLVGAWAFSGAEYNPFWEELRYDPDLSKFWTLFTYPFSFILDRVFWFALALWVLFQFQRDLERRIGSGGVLAFFFAVTFLGGLGFFVGTQLFPHPQAFLSLNLPLDVIVFTWCLVNPGSQIMLFAVIPIPTRVLMWLCVAALIIEHGWMSPLVGFFAALPLPLAWLYATDRIPFLRFGAVPDLTPKREAKKQAKEFGHFMDDVKRRERERAEKERLRKLFEDSLTDEDKKD
jgi:hypothetical protein